MLRIHNSLTGQKEEFKPLRANEVRMYVCGMTVYDYIHIGHARMLTVFDLVQRYLRARGYRRGTPVRDPFQLRLNAYRVLLTRGRDATVVFMPPIFELDETYRFFVEQNGFLPL